MPVLYVRIDDRLIHGQVVDGWLKPFDINQVLVVSDRISQEPLQKTLMQLAATETIAVATLNVLDSIEWLRKKQAGAEKIMILASSPQEILRLLENGIAFPGVVLGGLHSSGHELEISPSLKLSREDCDSLKRIAQRGVKVEAQSIPAEPPRNILDLLKA